MLPLADVRVVAIEQFGAGPWGTLQLVDLGAEVIKIEDPASGGDVARYVPPFQEGESSLFFETFNRNKKSVSLDLRHGEARAVFEDIVSACDVVYSNLRGDQPARLRLMYDDLKHANPRIVCCSLSGFGTTGPRAKEGGYDYMMQGLAGWMSLTGDPGGPPTKSGLSLVDLSGGYVSVIAVLAGIWRARRDGVGCDCDVSLFETALAELCYVGTWAASRGYVPPRRRNSAHPSIVPFQNFATADGWIVVSCPKEKFWELLCGAIGRPDLRDEFPSFADRDRRREELEPILEEAFRGRTSADWLAVLAAAGVPSAAVNDVEHALEDARMIEYEQPELGTVRTVGSPLRLTDSELQVRPAPSRGEHTEQVLVELCGYEPERIRELAAGGVFGPVRDGHGRGLTPDRSEAGGMPGRSGEREERREMPRQALQPEGMATPKPPYSPVVVAGDTVYTAGQIANDPDGKLVEGGIVEQTRRALENVRTCLEAAGCAMDDVVKVNAYLADLGDFPGYNEVYVEFFDRPYPARTSVGAALPPGVLVEIEAVARRVP